MKRALCDECGSPLCVRAIWYDAKCTDPEGTFEHDEEQSRSDVNVVETHTHHSRTRQIAS